MQGNEPFHAEENPLYHVRQHAAYLRDVVLAEKAEGVEISLLCLAQLFHDHDRALDGCSQV